VLIEGLMEGAVEGASNTKASTTKAVSVQHNTDGSTLTEYADGRVVQHGSDGSRIARSVEGLLSREANAEAEEGLAFEWGAGSGDPGEGRDAAPIPLLCPFMTDLQVQYIIHYTHTILIPTYRYSTSYTTHTLYS
jgi:hypothetical protein